LLGSKRRKRRKNERRCGFNIKEERKIWKRN
jgi:hypothetical protein